MDEESPLESYVPPTALWERFVEKLKSRAKCEQVLTISKARLHQHWGLLSATVMSKVESAVRVALGM